ncbi:hypothetical protein HMPREF3217_01721 [Finegoldia magna]|nr:hypothetical protein HMPREF3217_01721 [Finegoldia magna]
MQTFTLNFYYDKLKITNLDDKNIMCNKLSRHSCIKVCYPVFLALMVCN